MKEEEEEEGTPSALFQFPKLMEWNSAATLCRDD